MKFLTLNEKNYVPCPDCGEDMDGRKFYEHGYKTMFRCLNVDCDFKKKLWFDSYGRLTLPHETWVKRHQRKLELKNILSHKNVMRVEYDESLKDELKKLGGEYD